MKTRHTYLVVLVAAVWGFAMTAGANTLTWDANTGTSGAQDGSGNWDTSSFNWWDGLSSALWDNSNPDSAIIGNGGAAGVITLTTAITVGNLTFASGGSGNYVITNNTMTLSSPTTLTANKDGTIASLLAGGGVTKAGTGTVTLASVAINSTFSGPLTVADGAWRFYGMNSNNAPGVFGSNSLAITLGSVGKTGEVGYAGISTAGLRSTDKSFVLAAGGVGRFRSYAFAADSFTVSGGVSGSGDLEFICSGGQISLTGSNTFTGSVTVNNNGAALLAGPNLNTISNITVNGGASLYLGPTNSVSSHSISGTATVNANGILYFYTSGTMNSPVVINAGGRFGCGYGVGSPTTIAINGLVSGGGNLYLSGSGNTCTIGNTTNTFTGKTTVLANNSAYTLTVPKLADAGIASSLGAPTGTNAIIDLLHATLNYTGSGDTCNRPIKLGDAIGANNTGLDELRQSGTGLLLLSGALTNVATTNLMYLLLSGSTAGMGEISGAISDGVVSTPITKSGTGVWILSGTNSLVANVTVGGGVLVYRYTASKPSPGTNSVASGAALGLGVGGSGCFTATDVDNLYANTLSWAGLNANAGVGLDTGAGDFTYATSQTNNRALHKTGANMLTLTGSNTNTRGATVWDGTLAVSNASALGASGTITVNSNAALAVCANAIFTRAVTFNPGAALSGQGTYSNANWTTPAGLVLKPGLPAGVLTVDAGGAGKTLTLGTNNTLRIVLQPDGSYGKLLVNGALDISAATARLVVTGKVPASKTVLAEGTSRVGQFLDANVDLSGLNQPCTISYTPTQVVLVPPSNGTLITVW